MNIAFTVGGLIPPYIVRRIKSVEGSGIWRRWEMIFKGSLRENSKTLESEQPKKPNMTGNVVIIFLLLIA